jgi:DNA-binding transcriptional MerR regulator
MSEMADAARYGIEDLAELGGVSRRTVRYYVQQGLLPSPLGLGRGRHYGPEHLARLQAVKALQERGLSLEEVREELARGGGRRKAAAPAPVANAPEPAVSRSAWRRIELAPGVELHVGAERGLPSPIGLRELVAWCERHLGGERGER